MFELGRQRRPSGPYRAEKFSLKKALLLIMKQIGFLILFGGIIWLAHMLGNLHSRITAPHGVHSAVPKQMRPGAATAHGHAHSSGAPEQDGARPFSRMRPRAGRAA